MTRKRMLGMRLVVAALVALTAVAVVATEAPPAGAAEYVPTDGRPMTALWRDGSGRIYLGWMTIALSPTDDEAEVGIARFDANGVADRTFGIDGLVRTEIRGTGFGVEGTWRSVDPLALSFTPTGEFVIAWRWWNFFAEIGGSVVDRYSLTGQRLSRTPLGGPDLQVTAAADGRMVVADEQDGATSTRLTVIPDGPTVTTSGLRFGVDQLPGGPLYLSSTPVQGVAYTGEHHVHRVVGSTAQQLSSGWCASGANPPDLGRVHGAVPAIGSTTAHARYCTDDAYQGELDLTYVDGAAGWTRTVTGVAGVNPGLGWVRDGRVVVFGHCMVCPGIHPWDDAMIEIGASGPITAQVAYLVQSALPLGDGRAVIARIDPRSAQNLFVEVIGAPVPAIESVAPGDRSVTVRWTSVTSNPPVTGYRITPHRAGVAQAPITVGNVTSRTVTGLTNGVDHRFTVAAITASGVGSESAPSAVVRPGIAPAAPTNVRAASSGRTQVSLSWTAPPAVSGLPVQHYEMVAIADGVRQPVRDIGLGTTETVTGLTAGVIYAFEVRAVNAVGAGPWSARSNSVTPPRAPFPSHDAAATRLANELLGRAPTATERASWAGRMESGAITPGGVVAEVRRTTDHLQRVDPMARLYQAYFLRRPDAAGLRYWIDQRRGGRSTQSISNYFSASPEFRQRYGTLTNRQFVELVYRNVLGRPGEPAGVTYWTDELNAGRRTRGQVMVGFSEAPENRNLQAHGVNVSVLYTLLLQRSPTAAEYATHVATLRGGGTVAALADLLTSTNEYANRTP